MRVLKIMLVIIVVGISYLSLTPTETIIVGNDKISHFIAYSCLMFNIGLLTLPSKKKMILGMTSAIIFGVFIEVLQHFVPGRFMSIEDIYANSFGVFLGIILALVFRKKTKKSR